MAGLFRKVYPCTSGNIPHNSHCIIYLNIYSTQEGNEGDAALCAAHVIGGSQHKGLRRFRYKWKPLNTQAQTFTPDQINEGCGTHARTLTHTL